MKAPLTILLFTVIIFTVTAQNTRHEFISRGNHSKELALDTYVVWDNFETEEAAKQALTKIEKSNSENAGYGYLTKKQRWVIYLSPALDDIEKAKKKRDEIRKNASFKDAYLLTVHQ